MERPVGYRVGLSDADIQAFDYEANLLRGADFRLGQYESGYKIDGVLMKGHYEIGDGHMRISDAVWGQEHIGERPYDELLLRLARTPLFRRLQSIEQLTLPEEYSTMPNTGKFSRWEHIWGSLVFVRKMTEGDDRFDDRQRMVLQLRTLLSDVGHTAFSHLGDWMFQGPNGGEDMHDQDLKDILHVSGIEGLLAEYGFSVDETVFPDVHDWVECPSPDLCVDRVDYGFREILRWVTPTIPINLYLQELQNPKELFEIDKDGRLLMKIELMAKMFAVGFSLLPTEHWAQPPHRLQLQLFQGGVQSSVIDRIMMSDMHPREAMYGIDHQFMGHLQTWPMLQLRKVMKDIAVMQRQIFIQGRRADLDHIFSNIRDSSWEFPPFPNPLEPYTWRTNFFGKPYPPNVKFDQVDIAANQGLSWNQEGLVVNLPPLKARAINPPIVYYGKDGAREVRCLSESIPSYEPYLAGQKAVMAMPYRATVLMRPDIAEQIVTEHREAEKQWPKLLRRQRSAQRLAEVIRESEMFAAAHSFDTIYESDDHSVLRKRELGEQLMLFMVR